MRAIQARDRASSNRSSTIMNDSPGYRNRTRASVLKDANVIVDHGFDRVAQRQSLCALAQPMAERAVLENTGNRRSQQRAVGGIDKDRGGLALIGQHLP